MALFPEKFYSGLAGGNSAGNIDVNRLADRVEASVAGRRVNTDPSVGHNNIEAAEVTTGEYARYSLKKQVSRPVLWHNTIMKFMNEKEVKNFTEVGSGRVLTGLVKRTARQEGYDIQTYNIRDIEDLKTVYKN